MPAPRPTSLDALIADYEVLLLDAYGVLVDQSDALPHARAMLDAITGARRRFFVVTNDASRLPETVARRLQSLGLAVSAGQVVTSGSLLAPYFAEHDLRGARCIVLGPHDSLAYVRAAGGQVVPASADCDALIVCDESGYPFLDTVDQTLSTLFRLFDDGQTPALILPNPDLIYPKSPGAYGFTSGAAALLIEAGLARRYPGRGLTFARLGKPHRPLFDEARRRAGSDRLVMIGDQLETDIAGAGAAGMDSALMSTGVSRWHDDHAQAQGATPTYLLSMS